MRVYIFISIAILGMSAAACRPRVHRAQTQAEFDLVKTNLGRMTVQQAVAALGPYNRVVRLDKNSKQLLYEYNLPNGSAVFLGPFPPYQPTNLVQSIRYMANTNGLLLYPK